VPEGRGREDAIAKPLGPLSDGAPGIAGATATGDGRLALVMDLAGLAGDDGQPSTSLQSTG
jgi:two-component system chemotaxis sensor kinase CheA